VNFAVKLSRFDGKFAVKSALRVFDVKFAVKHVDYRFSPGLTRDYAVYHCSCCF